MKTYWTYEVFSVEGVKRRSLVIAPWDDLAAALAGAFKDVMYYIGVCGYKVALIREAVQARIDPDAWEEALDRQRTGRDQLGKVSKQWDNVVEYLGNGDE